MVNKKGQAALADRISVIQHVRESGVRPPPARIARRARLIRKAVILNKLD